MIDDTTKYIITELAADIKLRHLILNTEYKDVRLVCKKDDDHTHTIVFNPNSVGRTQVLLLSAERLKVREEKLTETLTKLLTQERAKRESTLNATDQSQTSPRKQTTLKKKKQTTSKAKR